MDAGYAFVIVGNRVSGQWGCLSDPFYQIENSLTSVPPDQLASDKARKKKETHQNLGATALLAINSTQL